MAIDTTHGASQRIAGSTDYDDHIFSVDSNGNPHGFQVSNAIVHVDDTTTDSNGDEIGHNLYLDGQTVISDGPFVVGTVASQKLLFATDSTVRAEFTTDGYFDLKSAKFKNETEILVLLIKYLKLMDMETYRGLIYPLNNKHLEI